MILKKPAFLAINAGEKLLIWRYGLQSHILQLMKNIILFAIMLEFSMSHIWVNSVFQALSIRLLQKQPQMI